MKKSLPPTPATTTRVGSGRKVNRREDILVAAARLFSSKGYQGTTIRDIADAVDMRSGSTFYHFESKHALLEAVVVTGIDSIHAQVAAARKLPGAPAQLFARMVSAHLKSLLSAKGRDYAAVMLHESHHLQAETAAIITTRFTAYEQMWDETLSQLQAAGLLKGDMRLSRQLLLGALNWTTIWYDPGKQSTPDDIAVQLCRLVLHG